MYQSFDCTIWFIISFSQLKESRFQIWILFFASIFAYILSQNELMGITLSKIMPFVLMDRFDHSKIPSL